MADWNPRANELFLNALDIDTPEKQRIYLDGACGDDHDLRQAVEDLLRAHLSADTFLDPPAAIPVQGGDGVIGTVIAGRYKLLQQIGEGGMGTVFMAEQTEPVRRMVALKLVKPGMDSTQVLARFEAERQALALMDHPNIARVLDAGATEAGRPFFVMELVKGHPITRYCDDNKLTPRQRLELLVPVCQAVQHAHQKGIIHRDLKPSNVLVASYDGRPVPKVIDFGLAKAMGQRLTERTVFTGFGAIVGTLEYMSPEQAEFNSLDVDTRTDVYSLGVLLYELLTGNTPLGRERVREKAILEVLMMIHEEEPPLPSTRLGEPMGAGGVPGPRRLEAARLVRGELDWITMRSLEKDRGRRYESPAALAHDIERFLRDEPVEAGPPGKGYRLRKFVKRHRRAVLAAGVVLLALVAGVIGTTIGLLRAVAAETAAQASERTARREKEKAQDARDEQARLAVKERDARAAADESARVARDEALGATTARHAIQIDQAVRAWERNDLRETERVLGLVGEPFRQTWEARFVRELSRRKALPLGAPQKQKEGLPPPVAMSGDGRLVVIGGDDDHPKRVDVWDAVTGRQLHVLAGHTATIASVAVSRDGRVAASTSRDATKVWDVETGEVLRTLPAAKNALVALSDDGGRLVVQSFDVTVWDLTAGRELHTLRNDAAGPWCTALSGDGRVVATALADHTVKLWETDTGRVLHTLRDFGGTVDGDTYTVSLSADGKRLATGSTWRKARVWDTVTGKPLVTVDASVYMVPCVALTRDGKRLVTAGNKEERLTVWDATTGQELRTFRLPRGDVKGMAVSDDGRRVVTSIMGDGVRVWQTEPIAWETRSFGEYRNPSYSADGSRLAALGNKVCVSEPASGREVLSLNWEAAHYYERLALAPDGRRLAMGILHQTTKTWAVVVVDVASGQEVLRWSLPTKSKEDRLVELRFRADGARIVTVTSDGIVRAWDAATGRECLSIRGAGQGVCQAMSADGKRLVTLDGDKSLTVWDVETGAELSSLALPGKGLHRLTVSDDGRRIATSFSDLPGVILWDADTGRELFSLRGHISFIEALAFSPDGKRLATGGDRGDRSVRLWDVATGQEVLTLSMPGAVYSLAFGPDGRALAVGSPSTPDAAAVTRILEAP